MYHTLLNRLIILTVCSLCLQGCRSSLQVTSEEPVLKKLRKTSDDVPIPDQVSVPDVLSSVVSGVPHSGLPTVTSAMLPSVATSTVRVALPTHHLAVGPDVVPSWQQASLIELEEESMDTKPVARSTPDFGAREWSRYFGEVGAEPSLPSNIDQILGGPCPFWPDKQVKDTHLLVLIPATVNGAPFSLNLLEELIKQPKGGGHATRYRTYGSDTQQQFGAQSPIKSYWVLMTRDVLDSSRSKKYAYQQALIARHASRTGLPYELPSVLEAATAMLSHYVRSEERLYPDAPWTYTRCRELAVSQYPAVVGRFSSEGLVVGHHDFIVPTRRSGVAALLKFTETERLLSLDTYQNWSSPEIRVESTGILHKQSEVLPASQILSAGERARLISSLKEEVLVSLGEEFRAFLKEKSLAHEKITEDVPLIPLEGKPEQGESDRPVEKQASPSQTATLAQAFGVKEWTQYFGEVGEEPSLPSNIDQILGSPCPFWPDRQVKDTHLLVLIPAEVNGEPYNLNLLGELIEHPQGGGHATKYSYYASGFQQQFGAQSPTGSYWVLMTREVLEGSRGQTYADQQALVAEHAERTQLPYELPGALEAATAMLSHYVRSGERLYSDSPWTYTRCRELVNNSWPVVVGGFSSGGLNVSFYYDGFYSNGVAGFRKF